MLKRTLIQRWLRKYRSPLPISTMARPVPLRCPTTPARCLLTAPIAALISVTQSLQRVAYRGSSLRAHGAATNRRHCESSMNGTNPSIAFAAGSRKSSGRGSACQRAPKIPQKWALPQFRCRRRKQTLNLADSERLHCSGALVEPCPSAFCRSCRISL